MTPNAVAVLQERAIKMSGVHEDLKQVPGIQFVDHVAIAVKQGELDGQVKAYEMLGFREVHREEVRGTDQVREALLQIGDGPNLIQLLEPLTPDSPVQKLIEQKRRPRRIGSRRIPREERAAGLRCDEGERISNHRQGSPQRLARDHGLFCSSEIASRQSLRISHRDRRRP